MRNSDNTTNPSALFKMLKSYYWDYEKKRLLTPENINGWLRDLTEYMRQKKNNDGEDKEYFEMQIFRLYIIHDACIRKDPPKIALESYYEDFHELLNEYKNLENSPYFKKLGEGMQEKIKSQRSDIENKSSPKQKLEWSK